MVTRKVGRVCLPQTQLGEGDAATQRPRRAAACPRPDPSRAPPPPPVMPCAGEGRDPGAQLLWLPVPLAAGGAGAAVRRRVGARRSILRRWGAPLAGRPPRRQPQGGCSWQARSVTLSTRAPLPPPNAAAVPATQAARGRLDLASALGGGGACTSTRSWPQLSATSGRRRAARPHCATAAGCPAGSVAGRRHAPPLPGSRLSLVCSVHSCLTLPCSTFARADPSPV